MERAQVSSRTFAGVVDWKVGIAEGLEEAFELMNYGFGGGNVVTLIFEIATRRTNCKRN